MNKANEFQDYRNANDASKDENNLEKTKFSFNDIQNWIVMVPLTVVIALIMAWCFYFRFMKAMMSRRKLIYVEVLDKNNSEIFVSRSQAK